MIWLRLSYDNEPADLIPLESVKRFMSFSESVTHVILKDDAESYSVPFTLDEVIEKIKEEDYEMFAIVDGNSVKVRDFAVVDLCFDDREDLELRVSITDDGTAGSCMGKESMTEYGDFYSKPRPTPVIHKFIITAKSHSRAFAMAQRMVREMAEKAQAEVQK